MKIILSISLLLCGFSAFAGGGSSIGVGNPASTNCLKLKGTEERILSPAGESTNCVVEEWKLFQIMNALNRVKPHQYGQGGMPNPSSAVCFDMGGVTRIIDTAAGQAGYCVVEEWKLFHAMFSPE